MSSIYKELSFENDTELIHGIQFTVLSPDEIRKMSVAEIVSTDTFSGNEPVIGGLFDNRMGVIEHNKICKTCEQKNTFCPGHFGHIELAKPVFYTQFFDMVRKILKCVCWRCSKLLVDATHTELKQILKKNYSRQKRFELIYKICSKGAKQRRCGQDNVDGCGAKLPNKITKENIGRIIMEWKEKEDTDMEIKKQSFSAEEVLHILKGISDEDAELLGMGNGFIRPEWLICTVFPVPPPAMRPSVRNDTGQRCEDDLTHKLCDIVKTNHRVKEKMEQNQTNMKQVEEYYTPLLYYHISTFIDNELSGIPPAKQRTGRPLRSVTQRLKSKEGRIRSNLMGKRVDFSARSVITPDPGISIDELGVPIKIAMNLTFPEVVNRYNRDRMRELIKNTIEGPDKYPGAKYVRKHNEHYRTIRLKNIDNVSDVNLVDGDIVDRHLQNGDYVLFNRQPSLHKMSMMAHRIRVMPYDTFRLNVCVTPSYNADYDGDEMNMHVPQSLQTENELIQLTAVPTQIISPKNSKPIISIVQDIALGIYRITNDNVKISQKQLFNILCNNSKFFGIPSEPKYNVNDTKKWSGQQLLSTIIPPNVNIQCGNSSYDPSNDKTDENYVKIEHGEIKQGIFDKKIYQSMSTGLIHTVFNDNGAQECTDIFDNTQKLICDWLVYDGFSVGMSDLMIDGKTTKALKDVARTLKQDVYAEIRKIHTKEFDNVSIKTNEERFEEIVNDHLNKATKEIGNIGMSTIDNSNRMLNMIKAGSKGSRINLIQMVGCLGQQSVEGKRISHGFDNRTLPHFTKYDDGPESRGFVESSFVNGLSPQEFFFHAMGGREGLIDTAVKTSETGYIQRKLVKAMEDCKINFDMSVRNASGQIIQFLYGDDGMNAIKLEEHNMYYVDFDKAEMRKEFLITKNDFMNHYLTEETFTELNSIDDWDKQLFDYYQQVEIDREYFIMKINNSRKENKTTYPIAFARMIKNIKSMYQLANHTSKSDLNPIYVLDTIKSLEEKQLMINKTNSGKKILGILLRFFLNPKTLITKYYFHKDAFDYLMQKIKVSFYEAIAPPSEMVGVVAAQSIGEPCTQLTLNTFHLSGVASASKAVRGVPRIKELLSVSKNMKAPSCVVYMKKEYSSEFSNAEHLQNSIEITYIKDVIKSSKVYYENNTILTDDDAFVKFYNKYSMINCKDTNRSPWVLRLELEKSKLLDRELTTIDISHTIFNFYEDGLLDCTFSDDNSDNIIFRITLKGDATSSKDQTIIEDSVTELKALEHNLLETNIIKGISGIKKVSKRKDEYIKYNPELGMFDKEKTLEWILDTDGTNLIDILGYSMVDATRTISNDINEIYQIFGIEAARECLLNEINDVLNDGGTSVNYRHIALLVDTMTSKGYMLSIDRHGINRSDIGPLAKCSFEETSDMLIKAGLFSEYDKVNGVSANIMMGQIPPCGTGDSQLIMDYSMLKDIEESEEEYDENEDDYEMIEDECILDNLEFKHRFELIKED